MVYKPEKALLKIDFNDDERETVKELQTVLSEEINQDISTHIDGNTLNIDFADCENARPEVKWDEEFELTEERQQQLDEIEVDSEDAARRKRELHTKLTTLQAIQSEDIDHEETITVGITQNEAEEKALDLLLELNVWFDTGMLVGSERGPKRDWMLDFSLEGGEVELIYE